MTIPFWCVLVAGVLPYVWVTVAARERGRQFGTLDNKLPRPQALKLTGLGARAIGAHNNAFEALPFFAAGVIIAHICGADPAWSADFAIAFILCRVAHGILYLTDYDVLRSLVFGLAQVCTIAFFVLAARA
jgi:uncharacterized MAPEG superfamily protein